MCLYSEFFYSLFSRNRRYSVSLRIKSECRKIRSEKLRIGDKCPCSLTLTSRTLWKCHTKIGELDKKDTDSLDLTFVLTINNQCIFSFFNTDLNWVALIFSYFWIRTRLSIGFSKFRKYQIVSLLKVFLRLTNP